MRIAFLGTPEFAIPSLKMLIDEGHDLCVFTQPDKPKGRHGTLVAPPVKSLALEHGIKVYQPTRIKGPDGIAMLNAFAPELMVTAAFGQILSEENLRIPKYGCINVHGSLLPKYRGAAPIQWAVINGEPVTGITTMMTDVGLDTGDILRQRELSIYPDEMSGELYERMAITGAELLKQTIDALLDGKLTRTKQNEKEATKCGMLKKEDGKLDFALSARAVHNRVRGTNPWPGAYALLNGESIKIWRTRIAKGRQSTLEPGMCSGDEKQGLFISCGDGVIEVLEIQSPGGKRMDAKTFLRGKPIAGAILN